MTQDINSKEGSLKDKLLFLLAFEEGRSVNLDAQRRMSELSPKKCAWSIRDVLKEVLEKVDNLE